MHATSRNPWEPLIFWGTCPSRSTPRTNHIRVMLDRHTYQIIEFGDSSLASIFLYHSSASFRCFDTAGWATEMAAAGIKTALSIPKGSPLKDPPITRSNFWKNKPFVDLSCGSNSYKPINTRHINGTYPHTFLFYSLWVYGTHTSRPVEFLSAEVSVMDGDVK